MTTHKNGLTKTQGYTVFVGLVGMYMRQLKIFRCLKFLVGIMLTISRTFDFCSCKHIRL